MTSHVERSPVAVANSTGTVAASSLAALAAEAQADLADLSHPTTEWVKPLVYHGRPVDDVLIVGAGQSGVVIAAALRRQGVERVSVLEAARPGDEGPWTTFARMSELRTPKQLVGHELGIPSLSLRRWFCTRYGVERWESIARVPRTDWKDYLDWLAGVTGVRIEHDTAVIDIGPAMADNRSVADGPAPPDETVTVTTSVRGQTRVRHARTVVLATGFDGAGSWKVPEFISAHLPSDRYHHSNVPFDLSRLAGQRIGILGHGASAFDNANAVLDAGAASVDLCFRRARLPRVNPHRFLETAGTMTHYPDLADETRWRIARFFRRHDQPPPEPTFRRALARPNFALRPDTGWLSVALDGDEVRVETSRGELRVDYLIAATGVVVDLEARPELRSLAPVVARWRDRYRPPVGEEDDRLGQLPYLRSDYSFQARLAGAGAGADWVDRVFAFNFAAAVSHAPHATSISGHKHAIPRLVHGVTGRLMQDMEPYLVSDLESYRSLDLDVSDDFEADLLNNSEVSA